MIRLTVAVGAVLIALAAPALPASLVVTNANDVVNGDTSSPAALIASPGPDGISLREALLAANNVAGPHNISFAQALSGQTIMPGMRFAPITRNGIAITGLTANGQPAITLDVSQASQQGAIFFVAASGFTMTGIMIKNVQAGLSAMQIGGSGFGLQGQPISSPQLLSGINISGNSFTNGGNNNTFAIFLCHSANETSNATISGVAIKNNSFSQFFEGVNIQGAGTNTVIEDVIIAGNAFTQMTALGTSAVEVGHTVGTNNVIRSVQIVQNTFTGNFQGVVINANSTTSGGLIQNVTIARNTFADNLQALGIVGGVDPGSTNNTVTNTLIADNVVHLNGYEGHGSVTIQIIDNQSGSNNHVTNTTMVNNTIYSSSNNTTAPPGSGVWVTSSGGVTGLSIFNTIFAGMNANPLRGVTPGQVQYSIVNQAGFTGVNHNFSSDPQFVNTAQGDFHLQAGSPAIGAGLAIGAPAIDRDCQPFASPPSIGAYQFAGPNICTASGGAPWSVTHDFNGDGFSDIAWRSAGGDIALWLMNGSQLLQNAILGSAPPVWSIVGQRDFNGDGKADLLWRDTGGNLAIWLLNGAQVLQVGLLGNVPANWTVAGTGDFNGDGIGDILWADTGGNVAIWLMNGATIVQAAVIGNVPTAWSIVGVGDFNGDGKADLLWRNTAGDVAIWLMNGAQISQAAVVGNVSAAWTVAGTGDFDGDGKFDIVWRRPADGGMAIWTMNGTQVASNVGFGNVATDWTIQNTGDYNSDGKSDILWRNAGGGVAIWFMNGAQIGSNAGLGNVPIAWTAQTLNVN